MKSENMVLKIVSISPILLFFLVFTGSALQGVTLGVGSQYAHFNLIVAVISMLNFALLFSWPLAVYKHLIYKSNFPNKGNRNKFDIIVIIIFLMGGIATPFGPREFFQTSTSSMFLVDAIGIGYVLLGIYTYLKLNWVNAVALFASEKQVKINSLPQIITFILFIYWPIGVFFLHGRLKRLE